jgi:ABC-type transport system substrate-binding protein
MPGYQPTIPPGPPSHPDPATVTRLLTEAGYTRPGVGPWTKDGKPLTLTIAAPAERDALVALAGQAKQQLAAAGIEATVLPTPGERLYASTAERAKTVDIVVTPRFVGGDPATALASRYGCAGPLPDGSAVTPDLLAQPCDTATQPQIDAALTGELPLGDALGRLEPILWARSADVPLFQYADEIARRPEVSGLTPGPPFVAPFRTAPVWTRRVH